VRNVNSDRALALQIAGVELVKGNLNEPQNDTRYYERSLRRI
jgi:hypothetical protein